MKTEEKTYKLSDYYKALKYRNNDKGSAEIAKGMMILIDKCQRSRNANKIAELNEMLNKFVVLGDELCEEENRKYTVEEINVPENLRDYFLAPTDRQKTKLRSSTKANNRIKCKTIHTARVCKSNSTFCR